MSGVLAAAGASDWALLVPMLVFVGFGVLLGWGLCLAATEKARNRRAAQERWSAIRQRRRHERQRKAEIRARLAPAVKANDAGPACVVQMPRGPGLGCMDDEERW